MNINLKDKAISSVLEDLKTHIDTLYDKTEDGKQDKAKRFKDAYKYYLKQLPKRGENEVSGYVEGYVQKAVHKLLPSLLNIFTTNEEQAVVFRPTTRNVPQEVVDSVNKAINDCFLRENNGYRLLSNVFKEALITGDAFVKVYIEEEVSEDEVEYKDWTLVDVVMQDVEEYPDTDISGLELRDSLLDENDPTSIVVEAKGKLKLCRIDRRPRVEFIPFSELIVDGSYNNIADVPYICHKRMVTVSDLLEMGFDEELVMGVEALDEDGDPLDTKKLVNDGTFIESDLEDEGVAIDDLFKNVYLYEHYVKTSLLDKKTKKLKLYQVYATKDTILEINEVDNIPFAHGIVQEIPGSFWGYSLYDKLKDAQDHASRFQRLVIQNAAMSSIGAYQAVKGTYDRQSLLGIRPGSVVEVDAINQIQPFTQIPLPQAVTIAQQQIDTSAREDMASSVGFANDAGALNNMAASTMAMAVHNSEMKDKEVAQCLANSIIRPMFELLYKLMRDEQLPLYVETAEGVQEVNTAMLPKRSEFYIDITTANDDAIQMQALNGIVSQMAALAQVPASSVITPVNQYNMFKEVLKRNNIHNVDNFITDPTPPKPTEEEMQMQAMQQQMQIEQAQINLDMSKAQLNKATLEVVKLETEVDEMIEDGEAKRTREQERSIVEFQKLALKEKELNAEAELELQQGRPVSLAK